MSYPFFIIAFHTGRTRWGLRNPKLTMSIILDCSIDIDNSDSYHTSICRYIASTCSVRQLHIVLEVQHELL